MCIAQGSQANINHIGDLMADLPEDRGSPCYAGVVGQEERSDAQIKCPHVVILGHVKDAPHYHSVSFVIDAFVVILGHLK